MKLFLTCAIVTFSSAVFGQNYLTFSGEYKRTNAVFHPQGVGFDVGMQFAVNERLSLGPQIGYNYYGMSDSGVWTPHSFGNGIGDQAIELGADRQSFFGGASAHYLLAGLDSKLQLHVGFGLNCHFFRESTPRSIEGNQGNIDWLARVEAQLPVSLVYIPNEEKRLRLFTSVIPAYFAPSSAHQEITPSFGQGIAMLSFRAGVQVVMGQL